MQYGGRQQQPVPGQRLDPLAQAGAVPSWPDQMPGPPGGPPRLAYSPTDGVAEAWPELPGLPPIGPSATEPRIGPRIMIPALAAVVVLGGLLVAPWHTDGSGLFTVASFFAERGPHDFGDLYAVYLAGPLGLLALLAGFAGATDLRWARWAQLGVAVTVLGGVAVLGLSGAPDWQVPLLVLMTLGLAASVTLAALKRLALRVAAGGYLVACALLHAGTLALWDAPWLAWYAYLPAAGYLLAACGAVIGPRYVPVYQGL